MGDAGAVALSFAHALVADRLEEAERERRCCVRFVDSDTNVHALACRRRATRYLVGSESLGPAYFVAHRSWFALTGVALFLAYTTWRHWWRARHPHGWR